MRVNKGKFIRKYLRYYRIVFKLEAPYNIILDGNFIFQALKYKIDIQERLTKLLQDKTIRLFVLSSVLTELHSAGTSVRNAVAWANNFCEIIDDSAIEGSPPVKLLKFLEETRTNRENTTSNHMRRNEAHYFIASQDKELRRDSSKIPGVPTIYFNKVSLVLEPPSKVSRAFGLQEEGRKLSAPKEETALIESVKIPKSMSIIGVAGPVSGAPSTIGPVTSHAPRTKKKANAPNPLSSKPATPNSKSSKKKRELKYKSKRSA